MKFGREVMNMDEIMIWNNKKNFWNGQKGIYPCISWKRG